MFKSIRLISRSTLLIYALIGIIVIGTALFAYSWQTINQLREEARRTSSFYAFALTIIFSTSQLFDSPDHQFTQNEKEIVTGLQREAASLQHSMSFPSIVLFNPEVLIPIEESTASADLEALLPEDDSARVARLVEMVEEMDHHNQPIPIVWYYWDNAENKNKQVVVATFHYADPPIVSLLQWIPLGQLILIMAFGLLGLITYRRMRQREQQAIWVGMARETAHQLSTPISSLMGWLELVSERKLSTEELLEFDKDIRRLHKISTRFGEIGKEPQLEESDLVVSVRNAFDYCLRRLPATGHGLDLTLKTPNSLKAQFAPELYEWVVENLIKNAVQALPDGRGKVAVGLSRNDKYAVLTVEDNGRGLSKREQNLIFRPGYTTRKGGWGLGLTFVKRIIEDYHLGEISVRSEVGAGTCFTVRTILKAS